MMLLPVLFLLVGKLRTETNLVTSPDPDVPVDCDKICGDLNDGVAGTMHCNGGRDLKSHLVFVRYLLQ